MKPKNDAPHSRLTAALEATNNLAVEELNKLLNTGQVAATIAHAEIDIAPINRKSAIFYRHLVPLRKDLVAALANSYRRCFKLALAHARETGSYPEQWAWSLIQPAIIATLESIRDWYILACDGENQYVQKVASIPYASGETVSTSIPLTAPLLPSLRSWRAPAWLFQVAPTLGILLIRSEHVPANDSEEKLSVPHTRLLLRAARRSFLWELDVTIETVRNEEIVAAGAIPTQAISGEPVREPKKPKYWLKGTEGLTRKADLSRHKQGLTEKQELAFSLKYEYQVGPAELAARMGIDRKTAHEHIDAANRKIEQLHSNEKSKANRAKSTLDL